MEISLGPAPTTWGREELKEFYQKIASSSVDLVYLGEIVCPQRKVLSLADLKEIADLLKQSGKKVFLSTMPLITSTEQFEQAKELFPIGYGIEANMAGILNLYSHKDPLASGKALVIGPFLNIYNWRAADWLARFGAERIVAPFELPHRSVADIAAKTSIPIEVAVWGNLPTSFSWRCYTARTFGLTQQDCLKKCLEYPEGILLKTVDEQDLFIINGPQVLAAKTHCLIEQLDRLSSIGVNSIRIQPHRE